MRQLLLHFTSPIYYTNTDGSFIEKKSLILFVVVQAESKFKYVHDL